MLLLNPLTCYRAPLDPADAETLSTTACAQVARFLAHRADHEPTPLYALGAMAAELGVAAIHIKDEGKRLGLGSFKALGGAYAVVQVVLAEASRRLGRPIDVSALHAPDVRAVAGQMTLGCATAGNHGRSVAQGAQLIGSQAVVFVHSGVSDQRAAAIARFGARIVRVEGVYEDSVEEAARVCAAEGWTVVSDTSWPGYEHIPSLIMQGYTALLGEALAAMPQPPTHVFVQAGVGGVAAALAGRLAVLFGDQRPTFIVVEPKRAACLQQSVQAAHPLKIAQGEPTVMAMLECYEPSLVAWRVLARVADAFMTVDEADAVAIMNRLARPRGDDPAIVAGESGGVGVAGLVLACADATMRGSLGLGPDARVLVVNTEGATDPARYAELVGLTPQAVASPQPQGADPMPPIELQALDQDMRAWRRQIHAHPEFGFEEQATAAFVAARLREFGLDEVVEGVGGTGVVATLKRGFSNRAIALRADMDALRIHERGDHSHRSRTDGVMHACGHDGHTAMLLGAARMLARDGGFDGVIRFIFQPAEEWGRGAMAMLDDSLLTRFPFDEIYGLHNWPGAPVGHFETRAGPVMSAEDNFEIVLRGLGGHASRPHEGREVLVAASATVVNLQTIVSRRLSPTDIAVFSVTELLTDGARNVLPSEARILGDARSFRPEVSVEIEAEMRRIAAGTAAAYGCEVEVSYTREFIPLINEAGATEAAIKAAATVFKPGGVNGDRSPITASEDFARFLVHRPGCFGFIGNGDASLPLHNPGYDFNDEALLYGARFHVAIARQQLSLTQDRTTASL